MIQTTSPSYFWFPFLEHRVPVGTNDSFRPQNGNHLGESVQTCCNELIVIVSQSDQHLQGKTTHSASDATQKPYSNVWIYFCIKQLSHLGQNDGLQHGPIEQPEIRPKMLQDYQSNVTIPDMKYLEQFGYDKLLKESSRKNWWKFVNVECSFLWNEMSRYAVNEHNSLPSFPKTADDKSENEFHITVAGMKKVRNQLLFCSLVEQDKSWQQMACEPPSNQLGR